MTDLCREVQERAADGELTGSESIQHLQACPECRAILFALRSVDSELNLLAKASPAPEVQQAAAARVNGRGRQRRTAERKIKPVDWARPRYWLLPAGGAVFLALLILRLNADDRGQTVVATLAGLGSGTLGENL